MNASVVAGIFAQPVKLWKPGRHAGGLLDAVLRIGGREMFPAKLPLRTTWLLRVNAPAVDHTSGRLSPFASASKLGFSSRFASGPFGGRRPAGADPPMC